MVPTAAMPDARHKQLDQGGGVPWLKTGASYYYHAQLRHPDKGRAIKGLVV